MSAMSAPSPPLQRSPTLSMERVTSKVGATANAIRRAWSLGPHSRHGYDMRDDDDGYSSDSGSDFDDSDKGRKIVGLGTEEKLQHEIVKLDCRLDKLQDKEHGWQPRRVVVTTHEIIFFKPGSPTIVDVVPLSGISRAYVGNVSEHRRGLILQQRKEKAIVGRAPSACLAEGGNKSMTATCNIKGKSGVFKMRALRDTQANTVFKSCFVVLDGLSLSVKYYESEAAWSANHAPDGFFSCVGLSTTDAGQTQDGFLSHLHICEPRAGDDGKDKSTITEIECSFETHDERKGWIEEFEQAAAAANEMTPSKESKSVLRKIASGRAQLSELQGFFHRSPTFRTQHKEISALESQATIQRSSPDLMNHQSRESVSPKCQSDTIRNGARSRMGSYFGMNSGLMRPSDIDECMENGFSQDSADDLRPQEDTAGCEFVLVTDIHCKNKGKVYFLKADTPTEARQFIQTTELYKQESERYFRRKGRYRALRKLLLKVHTNSVFQTVMATLILANFVLSMIELEIHPADNEARLFEILDVTFTLLFLAELLLNMSAHWFRPFWRSSFNVFDFCVVAITTISLFPGIDMKIISTLRLLRAFRIVRLFGRLGAARTIIIALSSAITPVCNVLVVVVGVMCVFAMFGATAYAGSSRFETFSVSLFTMFQVLCLDGWHRIMVDVEDELAQPSFPTAVFFISFIFVVVWVLMPVFVAAILDGYRTASFQLQAHDQRIACKHSSQQGDNLKMAIDPILHSLCLCSTTSHVRRRLDLLFDIMDVDESGEVSFEEMVTGLGKMELLSATLTMDEYEVITRGGRYLSASGEFTKQAFCEAMLEQWTYYVQRMIAQYMVAVNAENPSQEIVFMALKLLVSGLAKKDVGDTDTRLEGKDADTVTETRNHRPGFDIQDRIQTLEKRVGDLCEQQRMAQKSSELADSRLVYIIRAIDALSRGQDRGDHVTHSLGDLDLDLEVGELEGGIEASFLKTLHETTTGRPATTTTLKGADSSGPICTTVTPTGTRECENSQHFEAAFIGKVYSQVRQATVSRTRPREGESTV